MFDRLREVAVEAGRQEALAVSLHRLRGQGEHRQRWRSARRPAAGRAPRRRRCPGAGCPSARGRASARAPARRRSRPSWPRGCGSPRAWSTSQNSFMFRSLSSTTRICAPVIARPAPAGSVNSNVLPLPTSLSHQIRPPCISTKRFDSASPRPVPSRCLGAGLRLLELLEDPVEILGRDARAAVGDGNPHLAVDPGRADRRPARRSA